ncbi:MAG: hypothetical protein ACRC7N_09655 [Clostridium sp.]
MRKKLAFFSLIIIAIGIFSTSAFSKEKEVPLFMGEVQEVQRDNNENIIRVRAKGYLKGCSVYEEELIAIISENTILLPKDCKNNKGKVNPMSLQIEKGDNIFMELSNAMTKSLPPQVSALGIQVTKPVE